MRISRTLLLLPLLLTSLLSGATSIFDLLHDTATEQPRQLRLTVAMDSVLAKSRSDLPAEVVFTDVLGRQQKWPLEVSIRGKFRRQRCGFPPLKFNFKKKELAAAGLDKFDKYKVVSTCAADPAFTQLVLKEYLAYRVYNLLTPNSFRVQRVDITYVDVNGNHPERTEVGFIIEETDEMASRLGGEEVENALNLPVADFDPKAEATHALVQYLIGNGDVSLPMARNLKVVKRPDGSLIPVGYDFDFSGWVGAPYASPTAEVGQQSIYQRVYLGYAQSDETLRAVAEHFSQRRRAVMDFIANFGYLNTGERETVHRFAARFFRELGKKNANLDQPLYDQLRGGIAAFIPPGGDARSFRTMAR